MSATKSAGSNRNAVNEQTDNKSENIAAKGFAVENDSSPFKLFDFKRRAPKADDILVRVHYCGICHSDIHQAANEWGSSIYPMIPGHEITGIIEQVGSGVKNFHIGDHVGIGCMVDSCRECDSCTNNLEQHCSRICFTYNSTELDQVTPTYGGYSNLITVKEHFVCKIPKSLPLDGAAPLLCAGITTYSPLRRFNVGKNTHLGVIGLGGLGHMAVKFGAAMGANVTIISTSESKREDAKRLGAKGFVLSNDSEQMTAAQGTMNLIIDTVSAPHDVNSMINLLVFGGVYCMVGVPTKPIDIAPFSLIAKRPHITGSLIGGMKETQEMLDFCGEHGIICDFEKIQATPETIQLAYQRTLKSNVKYRFVLDILNAFK